MATANHRIDRLARELNRAGVEAYFCASAISMGYLHAFFEEGHERFLSLAIRSSGETCMICPALSAAQARRSGIADVRAWSDGEDPLELFAGLCRAWKLQSARIALDDATPAALLLEMQRVQPGITFQAGTPILSRLMRRKETAELECLAGAAGIVDAAYPAIVEQLEAGMSELDVVAIANGEMRRRGGRPTFCIAASGARAGEPHHAPDSTKLREGDVVILDFGCNYRGYESDITRTFCMGAPGREAREIYAVVLAAHCAARALVRPGVPCQEIDRAARAVIEKAGYGEFFVHRTGHGIGMRGHEEPYIVAGNSEPLETGNCFSIEPGIYLPGRLGVRLENIIAVIPGGHRSLNAELPPELASR